MTYTPMPDKFEKLAENNTENRINGFFVNNKHNKSYYQKHYNGFRCYIPPGVYRIRIYFNTPAYVHGGSKHFATVRFENGPTATFKDFIDQHESLPDLYVGQQGSATLARAMASQGWMMKKWSNIGEYNFLMLDYNPAGLLPDQYKETGGWLYVNLINRTGQNSVLIRSSTSTFQVDPKIYNPWVDKGCPMLPVKQINTPAINAVPPETWGSGESGTPPSVPDMPIGSFCDMFPNHPRCKEEPMPEPIDPPENENTAIVRGEDIFLNINNLKIYEENGNILDFSNVKLVLKPKHWELLEATK